MIKKQQQWINLIVSLSLILIPFGAVSAQEDPFEIFFTPDPAYIYIGGSSTTVVTVDLVNAVDIWSFDLIIEYDESVALLLNYELIDIFGGIDCLIENNSPGKLILGGCSGYLDGTPFYGDGTLLKLTFERVSIGTTPLSFTTASFGNKQSQRVPVVSDNGELNVIDYTDLLANLGVQGKLDRSGVNLSLAPGTTFGYSYYDRLSTDIPGNNLSIPNVVVDTYTVTASYEGCLSASGTIIIPSDTDTYNLPPLILVAGNSVSDDIINDDDINAITNAYGNPTLNPNADVNLDGLIDARDLALVAGNYGLSSAAAYADWLP